MKNAKKIRRLGASLGRWAASLNRLAATVDGLEHESTDHSAKIDALKRQVYESLDVGLGQLRQDVVTIHNAISAVEERYKRLGRDADVFAVQCDARIDAARQDHAELIHGLQEDYAELAGTIEKADQDQGAVVDRLSERIETLGREVAKDVLTIRKAADTLRQEMIDLANAGVTARIESFRPVLQRLDKLEVRYGSEAQIFERLASLEMWRTATERYAPSDPAEELHLGDTVQLKIGGPTMTVVELSADFPGKAGCTWFVSPSSKQEEEWFPVPALVKVPGPAWRPTPNGVTTRHDDGTYVPKRVRDARPLEEKP